MPDKAIVTFPEWGNFSSALNSLFQYLGVKTIRYRTATNKHLETGVMHSPETICFCFKPIIGGLVECVQNGANTLVWYDTHGQCRARYYPYLQNVVLKKLDHEIQFYIFDSKNIISIMKSITGKKSSEVLRGFLFAYKVLEAIEYAEKKAAYYRPRETDKGATDKKLKELLGYIENVRSIREAYSIKRKIDSTLREIKTREGRVPKVLIIGEVFLIHDSYSNHNLIRNFGNLGFEVHAKHTVIELAKHVIFNPYYRWKMEKKTKKKLRVDVGGHARENVMELTDISSKDYSGIIHVGPFGCMPEVTVNPILQRMARERNIPYLFLSFDVQTSDTGLQTRLEAFSDLIKEK